MRMTYPDARHGEDRVPLFETVTDLAAGAETLRRRPYGVIEVADGRLHACGCVPSPRS